MKKLSGDSSYVSQYKRLLCEVKELPVLLDFLLSNKHMTLLASRHMENVQAEPPSQNYDSFVRNYFPEVFSLGIKPMFFK